MRAVVQRVLAANVVVDDREIASIGGGLLVYLGAGKEDTADDVAWMVHKLATLRIFEDAQGKMSRDVNEVEGAVLIVSQFTLYGDVRKGRRPSFDQAAPPEPARALYEAVCGGLRDRGLSVHVGRFQADMRVSASVDGPVTILIDSRKAF